MKNKNYAPAILIGVLALAGLATGLFFAFRKPKDKEEENTESDGSGDIGSGGSGSGGNASGDGTSNIPFTNKQEGDKFRAWVNDKYPDYAKQIDLDRSGSYNNAYIKKAWQKYGQEYTAEQLALVASFSAIKSAVDNLGSGFTVTKTLEYVKIIKDNYKMLFYSNGRLIAMSGGNDIYRGMYYDGGKKLLITSGLNKGKTFNGTFAENIMNSLKSNFADGDLVEEVSVDYTDESEGMSNFGQTIF
jgi:hypothetical protein